MRVYKRSTSNYEVVLLITLMTFIFTQAIHTLVTYAENTVIEEIDIKGVYKGHEHVEARIAVSVPSVLPVNETLQRLLPPEYLIEGYTIQQGDLVLKRGGAYVWVVDENINPYSSCIDYLIEIVLKDANSGLPVIALEPIYQISFGGSSVTASPAVIHLFTSNILSLLNDKNTASLNLTVGMVLLRFGTSDFNAKIISKSPEAVPVTVVYTKNYTGLENTKNVSQGGVPTITITKTVVSRTRIPITITKTITTTKTLLTGNESTITRIIYRTTTIVKPETTTVTRTTTSYLYTTVTKPVTVTSTVFLNSTNASGVLLKNRPSLPTLVISVSLVAASIIVLALSRPRG